MPTASLFPRGVMMMRMIKDTTHSAGKKKVAYIEDSRQVKHQASKG